MENTRLFGYKCLVQVTDSDFPVKCTVEPVDYPDSLLWSQFFMNVFCVNLCDKTLLRTEFVSLQNTNLNVLQAHTHYN